MLEMKKYKSLFEEENIVFEDYKDALKWIDLKVKEYKSKNAFLVSNEYKTIYPYINDLYNIEKEERKKEVDDIMKSVGIKYGDKVEYTYVSPFFTTEKYTGIVVNRNGIPYVKYDKGLVDMKGRKSSKWHKGWKKIK